MAVAKAIGLTVSTYSKWETGRITQPSPDHLAAAAKLMEVDPGWLLTGREDGESLAVLNHLQRQIDELREDLAQALAESGPDRKP